MLIQFGFVVRHGDLSALRKGRQRFTYTASSDDGPNATSRDHHLGCREVNFGVHHVDVGRQVFLVNRRKAS